MLMPVADARSFVGVRTSSEISMTVDVMTPLINDLARHFIHGGVAFVDVPGCCAN